MTFQFRRNNRAATGFASALALLSAVSYPSMGIAQDVVLEAGQTDTDGVVLANGGSLTNRGAISHAGDGVSYPGPGGGVAFILNEAPAPSPQRAAGASESTVTLVGSKMPVLSLQIPMRRLASQATWEHSSTPAR